MPLSVGIVRRSLTEFFPPCKIVLFNFPKSDLQRMFLGRSAVTKEADGGLKFRTVQYGSVTLAACKLPATLTVEQKKVLSKFDGFMFFVNGVMVRDETENLNERLNGLVEIRPIIALCLIKAKSANVKKSLCYNNLDKFKRNNKYRRVFMVSPGNELTMAPAFDFMGDVLTEKLVGNMNAEQRNARLRLRGSWKSGRDKEREGWKQRKKERAKKRKQNRRAMKERKKMKMKTMAPCDEPSSDVEHSSGSFDYPDESDVELSDVEEPVDLSSEDPLTSSGTSS